MKTVSKINAFVFSMFDWFWRSCYMMQTFSVRWRLFSIKKRRFPPRTLKRLLFFFAGSRMFIVVLCMSGSEYLMVLVGSSDFAFMDSSEGRIHAGIDLLWYEMYDFLLCSVLHIVVGWLYSVRYFWISKFVDNLLVTINLLVFFQTFAI